QASDWAIRDGNQVAFRRLTLASCRPVAWKISASSAHWTRGYSSWTSSLIDEGKSDAADENCARIRKGQRKSEVVAGSGPHRDGAVQGGELRDICIRKAGHNADATYDDAFIKNRDAARIYREKSLCVIAVGQIGLAGEDAKTEAAI